MSDGLPLMPAVAGVVASARPFGHMSSVDAVVWSQIIQQGLFPAQRYDYDVRLGEAVQLMERGDDALARGWGLLTAKRVDVVAWVAGTPYIVEVKPQASMAALGQVLGYAALWRYRFGSEPEAGRIVACVAPDPDLVTVFQLYGVRVVSIPEELQESVWALVRLARRVRATQSILQGLQASPAD